MIDQQRVLAIVPARAGSKGLPGKNIRSLMGKPLLAWSIESAHSCPYIDTVILSTDSQVYADIGASYGATIPFIRPPELATDTSSSVDVILHALDFMAAVDDLYDIVVLLEPTSPLRETSDINKALELIAAQKAQAAVGICLAETIHPAFMFRRQPDQIISPLSGQQPGSLRRQDIEPLYFLEGSVYASDVQSLRDKRSFYHDRTAGVVVPYERSPEVDSEVDFFFVEALLRAQAAR